MLLFLLACARLEEGDYAVDYSVVSVDTCDLYQGDPYFQSWASADGATARYHQGPGQRDLVRLVDIDGQLLIIDAATWPELPSAEHDEALALLDSMTFELASS